MGDTKIHRTDNGVPITIGLRVFTNNWRWGTVVEPPREWDERGWFTVDEDGHGRLSLNGERMTTIAPGLSAVIPGHPDPVAEGRVGQAVQCMRLACYNARNSRECWMAEHIDGGWSFEWPTEDAARRASSLSRHKVARKHQISAC